MPARYVKFSIPINPTRLLTQSRRAWILSRDYAPNQAPFSKKPDPIPTSRIAKMPRRRLGSPRWYSSMIRHPRELC